MKRLFFPAIALMNKLHYAQKFMVLGLIYFVAVTAVVYSLYAHLNHTIRHSQRQLQGIALIKPIAHTIQLMQEHRGLELGMLSGNQAMRDTHYDKERLTDAAVLELDQKWLTKFATDADWLRFKTDWQVLHQTQHTLSIADNFEAHTALIEQLQQIEVKIADYYKLNFDSDIAAYYLVDTTINKLPIVLDKLEQMRAFGTSILVKKQLSEAEKIKLFTLIAEFNSAFKSLSINLEKTSRYNSEIKTNLLAASKDIAQSTQQIIEVIQSDILSKKFATPSESYFKLATSVINKGYSQLYQNLLPSIELLLRVRIEQVKKELRLNIIIALLALLVATYIFAAICYTTVSSIQSLSRSAQKFASGDFKERIRLNTRDELKQIAKSFNEMANAFSHLLETHHDNEERLHAIINSALDAVIQMDAHGNVTGWSKQAEAIFGWRKEEVLGLELATLIIPPRYREAHNQGYRQSNMQAICRSLVEYEGLHRAGHEFPIELSVSTVKTARGIEFSAFIRDISTRKATEDSLRILSSAVEQSPSSIVITDLDANIQFINKAFTRATGYSLDETIGQNPRILHSGKTPQATFEDLWSTLTRGEVWQGELINQRKDGSEYIELALISPIRQPNGEISHYLAVKEDITEKKRAETELRIAAAAFESQEAILVSDADNLILRVNKAFTEITGYRSEEVIGKNPSILKSGRQDQTFYTAMWHSILNTGAWQGEIWDRRKNGTECLGWMTITAVKNSQAETTHYVATLTDMTERKLAEEKIKQLAFYDALTDLPNRRKLLERLESDLASSRRKNTSFAVLMMDLDYFKAVNDSLGHLAGDELLQQVAKRITSHLRETDMVARLGGDEFVILLEDIGHEDNAAHVARNIIADLTAPFQLLQNKEVRIGASVGISLYPQHGNTATALMDNADIALYQAKDQGRGCFAYFSTDFADLLRKQRDDSSLNL